MDKEEIALQFMLLQDEITQALEELDGVGRFKQDIWERNGGGGGRSRILENGSLIEKGGVNFSKVFGIMPSFMMDTGQSTGQSKPHFFASGVSIVLHPVSPWVPVIHMNIRYFEDDNNKSWFGGGIDLTPHYIDRQEASTFHDVLKRLCTRHPIADYTEFKKNADEYFFLPHRSETRGIGGIFFDHLKPGSDYSRKQIFEFVIDLGRTFFPLYRDLTERQRNRAFGDKELEWQKLRRGRYVEFNLLYDKGTRFGLETNGRTESILMSLPPVVNWKYNIIPVEGSEEYNTSTLLRKGIDW